MSRTYSNRILLAAVSILLSLLMVFLLPAQKFAAAEKKETLYVKELRLGYGKNVEEAAKSLNGYVILKNGDKYADLNEGSGKKTVVLMGYKTTAEREEAITDIAAMNMKGGYSFSEYESLMEQYRDSQIMPFINRFMSTVNEYRTNYNGSNENNKLKAQYIHDVLNMYIDDDSGMGLGDVFLKTTAEEFGLDKYNKLSNSEKKKYGCLSTILMQGQVNTIFFIEQILTLASDTSDTTWLQRFQSITPESLLEKYTREGMGESDARKALAREYEDTARLLADKWAYFRDSLLEYDNSLKAEDGGTILDSNDADILNNDGADADEAEEEDEEEESDESQSSEGQAGKVSSDEIMAQLAMASIYAEEVVTDMALTSASNVRTAFIYNYLRNMKYNGKTMYDYFTTSVEDITEDNFFALYPLVASLTAGQISGVEFLSLEHLVTIGSTDNTAYKDIIGDGKELVEKAEKVSVYAGVNRELYGKDVALTDKAMRDNAAGELTEDNTVGQIYTRAAVIGVACVVLLVPTLKSISAAVQSFVDLQPTYMKQVVLDEASSKSLRLLNQYRDSSTEATRSYHQFSSNNSLFNTFGKDRFLRESTSKPGKMVFSKNLIKEFKNSTEFKNAVSQYDKCIISKTEVMNTEKGMEITLNFRDGNTQKISMPFKSDLATVDNQITKTDINKVIDDIDSKRMLKEVPAVGTKWGAALKTTIATAFSVLFLGLSMYDLYRTVNDLKAYYNVDMTRVPKYVVDRADLTMADENGKSIVVRNEGAYYQVIRSNREREHKFYTTMQDYGDVNAAEGKQWLVLYTNRSTAVHTPILADSLKIVTGKADMPDGYTTGIHMFGENTAVNMTSTKFTYEDKLRGIYVYYKNAPALTTASGAGAANSDAPATSSVFGRENDIIPLICGLLAGIAVGVFIMAVIKRKNEAGTE